MIDASNSPILPGLDVIENYSRSTNRLVRQARELVKALSPLIQTQDRDIHESEILITGKEVGKILGVSTRTVNIYRAKGHFGCVKYSDRKILYRKREVIEFLNSSYNHSNIDVKLYD